MPGRFFGWLLLLAFLASVIQKWALQCLGDEVSVNSVFSNASSGKHFFKVLTGVSRLNELLLGRLGFLLEDGDVL